MPQKLDMLATLLVASLLVGGGCSSANNSVSGKDNQATRATMTVLSEFYGNYLQSHRGRPPKDSGAFHKYLESRSEDLKLYNVASPDQLFTSSRDGQQLTIVCGERIAPADSPDTPWAAYEQTGVDGKRLAVRVRGGIHELSDDEIAQTFQNR